ncbi:MAG: hypothetical protein FWF29_12190 [Treponema sp.]|nr:hypothetical protein [Treponema sp.]
MVSAEKIHTDLEECLKSINSTGLGSLDPLIIEKLDSISIDAAGLGLEQGKKLIENLSAVLRNFKEGKSGEDSVTIRLTALEFYLHNTQAGASAEEL